jgi:hypothetical protein
MKGGVFKLLEAQVTDQMILAAGMSSPDLKSLMKTLSTMFER